MSSQDTSRRDVALQFVRYFCAGDIAGLASLLDDDLRFKGPLHHFDSKDAYLQVLREDPPAAGGYELLAVTESDDTVAVFYDYLKADEALTIAQLFKLRGQRITEILVVFDASGFS